MKWSSHQPHQTATLTEHLMMTKVKAIFHRQGTHCSHRVFCCPCPPLVLFEMTVVRVWLPILKLRACEKYMNHAAWHLILTIKSHFCWIFPLLTVVAAVFVWVWFRLNVYDNPVSMPWPLEKLPSCRNPLCESLGFILNRLSFKHPFQVQYTLEILRPNSNF